MNDRTYQMASQGAIFCALSARFKLKHTIGSRLLPPFGNSEQFSCAFIESIRLADHSKDAHIKQETLQTVYYFDTILLNPWKNAQMSKYQTLHQPVLYKIIAKHETSSLQVWTQRRSRETLRKNIVTKFYKIKCKSRNKFVEKCVS